MDRPDEGRAERNSSTCRELTLPFDSTFRYFDARARSRAPFPSDFIVKVMHLIDRSLSPSLSLVKYFETVRSDPRSIYIRERSETMDIRIHGGSRVYACTYTARRRKKAFLIEWVCRTRCRKKSIGRS